MAAGMSYLEATSVLDSTRRDYKARLMDFLLWASNRRLDWHDAAGLDQTLLVLFDELFFKGIAVGDASKLLAAIKFYDPRFHRVGPLSLPRADRS